MSFYRKVKYFLVHTLMLSNKEAQELIDTGQVEIDGASIRENCPLNDSSEIKIHGHVARKKKEFIYLKFHKPPGFESTLNPGVEGNISGFFTDHAGLSIAGRLDKHSEGLLLLSNDGKWVENMCNPKFEKEKEYLVSLDKIPDEVFLKAFSSGVRIGSYITASCTCVALGDMLINVILREGKNRQIRRMCRALGYGVLKLKRIRIDSELLSNLRTGESEHFVSIHK